MKKLLPLFLAVFLSACLPSGVQVPQSPLLSLLERKIGMIAYIGIDGNVYATDQSVTKTSQLTKDATPPEKKTAPLVGYQIPTWSQDSNHLAFIRMEQTDTQLSSKLFIANMEEETVKAVYASNSEHPFYLYWSPDDSNLSFLSSTSMGEAMMLQSISAEGGERRVLDSGSPFYWSWAPDGKTMLIHRGVANSIPSNNLSFLHVDSEISEYGLEDSPAAFQAPAWSPNGEFILLAETTAEGQEIILADSSGANQKSIASFEVSTAFAWSFDSKRFAYISSAQELNPGSIGSLHVYDLASSEETVMGESVIGFFWSPNGRKLAYFVPFVSEPDPATNDTDSTTLFFQLNMLDVATGGTKELFTFRPTDQFVSIIPYFDQYHQSTTIWSPDSNNLVLSYIDTDGNPGIATVAASGNLEPRPIAEGYLAFWSWK